MHSTIYDMDFPAINLSKSERRTINNQTQLFHELELLRNENYQLRLRVYNAEQRVDRLLSAAAIERDLKASNCTDNSSEDTDTDSDSTDTDSDSTDTDSDSTDTSRLQEQCRPLRSVQQLMKTEPWARNRKFGKHEQQRCMARVANASSGRAGRGIRRNNAAAVYIIHDLLTLNRRLLALMAATVSDKSVSTDSKRRWGELRNHIEEYAVDGQNKEKTNEDEDHDDDNKDEFYDASAMDSETFCRASAELSVTRQNVLRSPPPSTPLQAVSKEDESVGSDVTHLQGQCRPIRSVRQLMKTELWAQNRKYFGKVEQKRFMAQVAYAGAPRDGRSPEQVLAAEIVVPPRRHRLQEFHSKAVTSTASMPRTKGILVVQSAAKTLCNAKAPEAAGAAASSPLTVATTTTPPPPVLPDCSEMDLFFSCAEDDDDDDHDRRECFAETKCTFSSKEIANWNDCGSDEEPERLPAIHGPVAPSMKTLRHCRPHHRQRHQSIKDDSATVTTTTSSSTDSAAAEDEANESNSDAVTLTKTIDMSSPCTTKLNGTASVGSRLNKRRRCMLIRQFFSGGVDTVVVPANRPWPPSVAVAQVQLLQLHCELNAQRRENGRLNDILLTLQREMRPGDRGTGDGGPSVPFPNSDPSGSLEPSQPAAGAVHGRIAKLLPPLLPARPISDDDADGGDGDHRRNRPDDVKQHKRQELDGVDDDPARAAVLRQGPEDPLNDLIRRMDHTELVNVGLPMVVARLHRALALLQNRPENVARK